MNDRIPSFNIVIHESLSDDNELGMFSNANK